MDYLNGTNEGKRLFRLENHLASSLKPVSPDPRFIDSLKHKLSTGSATIIEHRQDYFGVLALGLGLAAGALILWMLRRLK
jgi:hypothetical protein